MFIKQPIRSALRLTLLALCLTWAAQAQVQGQLYNGLTTAQNGSLCLAVDAPNVTNGPLIITSDCAAGVAGQMFYMAANGGEIHVGSAGSPYCLAVAPTANGSADYHGATIYVAQCAAVNAQSFTFGAHNDIISNISQTYQLCLGIPAGANTAGYQVTLQDDGLGAHPYQAWRTQPAASSAATTTTTQVPLASLINPAQPLDGNGCWVDRAGKPIPGFPCGNYIVAASGGKAYVFAGNYPVTLGKLNFNVVAAGAGNIILNGGGNIVAAGAGNIILNGGGNIVAAGAGNLVMANDGTPAKNVICNIILNGGGNIILNGGGNIVAAGAGNIILIGGSNIVAAGAGNIVAAGAGNFVGADATATTTYQVLQGIINSPAGQNPVGSLQLGNAVNLGSMAGVGGSNPVANAGVYTLAGTPPYTVLALTPSSLSWPSRQSMYFQWQHAGTPGNNTVSFYFQPPSGAPLTLSSKNAANLSSTTIAPAAAWPYTGNTAGAVVMKDDATGQQMASVNMTLTIPVSFQLTGLTTPGNTGSWQMNTTLPLSWTYNGVPPANDTVTVYMQVGSTLYTLTSPIPLTSPLPYQLKPPVGLASGTSMTLSIKDSMASQSMARVGTMTLVAAPGTATMPAYRIMAVTPQPATQHTWQLGSSLTVNWVYDGTLPPNDTLTVYLAPGGSLTPVANNIPVARMTATVTLPASLGSTPTAAVVLVDTAGYTAQASSTIALAAPTAPAPAPAPAPKPVAQPAAPPVAAPATVTVGQLSAPATWVNLTPLTFTWNTSGTAPGNQYVILQMQALGQTWNLTSSIWAGYKTYQTATYNWKTILKTTQQVTLTLLDGASGKPVGNALKITVSIP